MANPERNVGPKYFHNGQIQYHAQPGTFYTRLFLLDKKGFSEKFRISGDYAFGFEHFRKSRYILLDSVISIIEPGGISQRPTFIRLKEDLYIRAFLGNCSLLERCRMIVGHIVGMFFEWIS